MADLTYDEKRQLSLDINRLPGGELCKIVQIIERDVDAENFGPRFPDEIEIDFETLPTTTLRNLEAFVSEYFARANGQN